MRRLIAAGALALALPAGAQSVDWYVQVDNDVAVHSDRWYTSGMRVARVEHRAGHALEWSVSQEIYTPEAQRYRFFTVDRPPAARLLFSLARHDRRPGLFQTLEVVAGVRGPSAQGRRTTDLVHRLIEARRVDWSQQGGNHFDGQLVAVRSLVGDRLTFHYGAVVGTQLAFAHAGAEIAFGARGHAPASNVLRFAATPPGTRTAEAGWGAWLGASARAVARNRLLTPGYDPLAPDPRPEDAVARLAGGFTWSRPGTSVSFAIAFDSREFRQQRVAHGFGAFAVQFEF